MKATGEVMAIDRTFEAALQKAVRSPGDRRPLPALGGPDAGASSRRPSGAPSTSPPTSACGPSWPPCAAARRSQTLHAAHRHRPLVPRPPAEHRAHGGAPAGGAPDAGPAPGGQAPRLLRRPDRRPSPTACRLPGAGARAAPGTGTSAPSTRWSTPAPPSSTRVTPYFYSTYEQENEALPLDRRHASLVIGSGPIRIGQGIEFDYCSVHAAWALQEAGYKALIGQLQPGDRLDRLRHLATASTSSRWTRRASARSSHNEALDGAARRADAPRDRPVRRPDRDQPRRARCTAPALP